MNYIGSKLSILDFIDETVNDFVKSKGNKVILCDLFSRTGTVGKYFRKKGYTIISNDIEYYSYITAKHFIENNEEISFSKLKKNGIENVFEYLNNIDGKEGFIYSNYSVGGTKGKEFERQYFSDKNAQKIDAVRMCIETWMKENLLDENEYYFLIASLIESADKVANTASVYEAFLKKLKKSAEKEMILEPIEILISQDSNNNKVYNEDCNKLIKK